MTLPTRSGRRLWDCTKAIQFDQNSYPELE